MKDISVNRLSDFEFHDAEIAFDSFGNNQLAVTARYLNIHKEAWYASRKGECSSLFLAADYHS